MTVQPAAREWWCAWRRALPVPLTVGLLLLALPAAAQFNGDFTIQKHTLDAENFLDWKAYQHPFPWRYEAYRAPNILRATVGSLSQTRFYFLEEIRLEKDLGRYATVTYHEQEDSFYRPEPIYREVELRFGRGWYVSILGFPRHEKVLGHQGLALAWGERTDWNFLRLTQLDQYILFNEQGGSDASFTPAPIMQRLEARTFWREWLFFQIDVRSERPARLRSPERDAPALGRLESYAGLQADVVLDLHWSPRLLTGLTWHRDWERRARQPDGAASAITRAEQELDLTWTELYAVLRPAPGHVVEAGIYRGTFGNRIRAAVPEEAFSHDLLTDAAYVQWTRPDSWGFDWLFSLQAGGVDRELTDPAAPRDDEQAHSTEMKAGVGIAWYEADSYRFLFNTTWDLDVFTSRQWDGGNLQLLFFF
jgi:hypothetical protein